MVTRRSQERTTFRGWCNRQHNWFWSSYWGFESSPPNQVPASAGTELLTLGSGLGPHRLAA